MSGVPQEAKSSRRRRLKATAKAKTRQAAVLVDRARAKAAAALAPDPEKVNTRAAAAKMASGQADDPGPVTFTRRDTGAQIRLSRIESDSTESEGTASGSPSGESADQHFKVECLTHHGGPEFFSTFDSAAKAARHSERWCAECDGLALVKPKVRVRERRHAKAAVRQQD
jgi:hypothetical protein